MLFNGRSSIIVVPAFAPVCAKMYFVAFLMLHVIQETLIHFYMTLSHPLSYDAKITMFWWNQRQIWHT